MSVNLFAPLPCGRSCRGLAGAPEHGLFSVADHARGTSRPTQRERQGPAGVCAIAPGLWQGCARKAKEGARKVLILPTNAAISLAVPLTGGADKAPVPVVRRSRRSAWGIVQR